MNSHLVLLILLARIVHASPRYSLQNLLQFSVTATYHENAATIRNERKRQITSSTSFSSSTIGYVDGNPAKPFILPSGYSFRVDEYDEVWGTCTTTASTVGRSDCILPAGCYERAVSETTWFTQDATDGYFNWCTATASPYCGTAIYISNQDVNYSAWFCASKSSTIIISASATATLTSSTTSSTSSPTTSPLSTIIASTASTPTSSPTPTPTQSLPPTSSKSSPKTSIIVGVLVPILVLGAIGAIMLIRRYRQKQRRRRSAAPEMASANNIDGNRKESEAFIPHEPIELPAERRISELPAEQKPVEVVAVNSPAELASEDELSRSSLGSPRLG